MHLVGTVTHGSLLHPPVFLASQAVFERADAAEAAIGERIDTTAGTSTADTLATEATHSRRE